MRKIASLVAASVLLAISSAPMTWAQSAPMSPYDAAAKADTAGASMYYSNEAILLTQLGEVDKAAAAADKAIAADPTKPLPYYLKGQALVQKAGMDEKTQKVTVPPGCAEAYQKYLQLEPNGPHAEEVRGILQGIGVKVESKYKAK